MEVALSLPSLPAYSRPRVTKLDAARNCAQYLGPRAQGAAGATLGIDGELNSKERLRWEQELLQRARRGAAAAHATLYRTYAPLIFSRVLLPRLGNRAAAEDALAETFRTALERLDQFESRNTSIYFWLARIAVNKATDLHRARAVTGRALVNLEGQIGVLLESPLTPDAALDCKKQYVAIRRRLDACLNELNPRYRRAIEVRFVEELTREECATALDVKLGTFDVLLLRALKSLRKAWELAQTNDKEVISVRLG